MKTVKKIEGATVEVRRVSDEVANTMTKNGWSYCPKSEFKKTQAPKPQPKPAKKEDKEQGKVTKWEGISKKGKGEGKRAYMEAKADKQGK